MDSNGFSRQHANYLGTGVCGPAAALFPPCVATLSTVPGRRHCTAIRDGARFSGGVVY